MYEDVLIKLYCIVLFIMDGIPIGHDPLMCTLWIYRCNVCIYVYILMYDIMYTYIHTNI